MAKVDDPKALEPLDTLALSKVGPIAPAKGFFQQFSLLHIMISLIYFAVLFWALKQILNTDDKAAIILFGVLLGMGIAAVGLFWVVKVPRFSMLGWIVFVVGYLVVMAVTTTFFAIPALPILIGTLIYLGQQRRANDQDSLVWVMAVAAERGMPLAPGVLAFSEQVSGLYRIWAQSLGELLRQGVPLPDALESMPRMLPRRTSLLVRSGWEAGRLPLGLSSSIQARADVRPIAVAIGGRIVYLGWVSSTAFFIVGFVLYFIIPKFEAIFKDFGIDLPQLTKLVIRSSHVVVDFFWVPSLAFLGAFLYSLFMMFGPSDRSWPLIDRLFVRRHSTLILRALAVAIEAGRPIPPALDSLAHWYPTGWVRRKLAVAAADAAEGHPWPEALRLVGLLSDADLGVIAASQRAGNLAWALRELAATGERRLAYRLQAWTQVLFVVTLLSLGALVFVLATAFFLPLVSLIERLS
jgi:protein transport protein HofC